MSKFSTEKHGYTKGEVDGYVNNLYLKYEEKLSEQKDRVFALKNELDQANEKLFQYIEKDKQISQALIYAVEKADEIESASKKIYELEIKRVRLLYKRWEELLLEVEKKYPQINTNQYIHSMLNTFKESINDVLEENFALNKKLTSDNIKYKLKNSGDNYIKNVLNKMGYAFREGNQIVENQTQIRKINVQEIMGSHEKERSRINQISNKFNKLSENLNNNHSNIVDAYLNGEIEDEFDSAAYAENLTRKTKTKEDDSVFNYAFPTPNESGFDLKEALNPTEDLEEIMKAFDFFEKNDND